MVKRLTNPFADRPAPLGTLLSTAGRRLAGGLDAGLTAAGYDDLRSAHAPLFMTIEPGGSSVTELAERAHMTKQAMGELVRYLQTRGTSSLPSTTPTGGVRRVTLTARGWQALEVGTRVIDEFETWLDGAVGASQVTALRRNLDRIFATEPTAWLPD